MNKNRRTYTREFKLEALRLLETSGKSAAEIERDLGIGQGCLSRWKKKFQENGKEAFPGQGHIASDQERIRELERENEILRQERDILKKAVAIFTHPNKRGSGSSGSGGGSSR
jgi:transposase